MTEQTRTAPTSTEPGPADRFRVELREWLDRELTPEVAAAGGKAPDEGDLELLRDWNRRLADAGWAAPAWPTEHGGRGADIDEQLAYLEEMSAVSAPGPLNVIGVSNIAPAIMAYGTDAQQERFLRPMLRGDETGPGDVRARRRERPGLAPHQCRGRRRRLRGQRPEDLEQPRPVGRLVPVYVRTDPDVPKHKGISCLLVDLRTPGIDIRPVRTITGEQPFSELFFADVRVPRDALLGPLHQGWQVAMTTLSFERAGVARLHLGLSRKLGNLLSDPAARPSLEDPRIRDRVAGVYADIACMRWMCNRSLAQMRNGQPTGPDGSLAKLAWGRAEQRLAELAVDMLGVGGGVDGPWTYNLAAARQTTIAGGTTEINLNIIAEMGLGLPREPRPA